MIPQSPHIRPIGRVEVDADSNVCRERHGDNYVDRLRPLMKSIAGQGAFSTNVCETAIKRWFDYTGHRILTPASLSGLTFRQRQALVLLLCGCSEKELAAGLEIRPSTAHAHVRAILVKFSVHSRSELMALFLRPLAEAMIGALAVAEAEAAVGAEKSRVTA